MAVTLPQELKYLQPFVNRAEETKKQRPIVAYWCLMHVAQLAAATKLSNEAKLCVAEILDTLEKMKVSDDYSVSKGQQVMKIFSTRVFEQADMDDRLEPTDRTARIFLAASQYLEVYSHMSQDNTVQEMIKYAKWRAVTILKAHNAGEPIPRPIIAYEEDEEEEEEPEPEPEPEPEQEIQEPEEEEVGESETVYEEKSFTDAKAAITFNLGINPESNELPPALSPPQQRKQYTQPPQQQQQKQQQQPPQQKAKNPPQQKNGKRPIGPLPSNIINSVTKYVKNCISAMEFDDRQSAIDNLKIALDVLENG